MTVRSSRASWCAKGGHGIHKTYTAGHARAHGGPNRARGTRTTPCLLTPTSGAQPAPARRAHAPTRQGGAARGKFCLAGATARYLGRVGLCLVGSRLRHALGPSPQAAQGPGPRAQEWKAAVLPRDLTEAGRFHGVPRARRRMYWVIRRSRNASRRAQPPYTAASRLQTRCTCETNAKAWSSVTVVQKSGTYILTFITPYSKRITPLVRSNVYLAGLRQRKSQPR